MSQCILNTVITLQSCKEKQAAYFDNTVVPVLKAACFKHPNVQQMAVPEAHVWQAGLILHMGRKASPPDGLQARMGFLSLWKECEVCAVFSLFSALFQGWHRPWSRVDTACLTNDHQVGLPWLNLHDSLALNLGSTPAFHLVSSLVRAAADV